MFCFLEGEIVMREENSFDDFDAEKIGDHNARDGQQHGPGERGEFEIGADGREWNDPADDCHDDGTRDQDRARHALEEWNLLGSDEMNDECLCGQGFNEPSCLKHGLRGMESKIENDEGCDVEQGTHGAECQHVLFDVIKIPSSRFFDPIIIYAIRREGDLREIVQQVVEQDLNRQHGEKGEEKDGAEHAKHVSEV